MQPLKPFVCPICNKPGEADLNEFPIHDKCMRLESKMENPAWWGPVVKLINEEHVKRGGIAFQSLGMRLFCVLQAHGYLSEKAIQEEEAHSNKMIEQTKK